MWMRSLSIVGCLFSFVLWANQAGAGDGVAYQAEDWNTENPLNLSPGDRPPADGENLWACWDEDFEPNPSEGAGGNYHHKPMYWSAQGGIDNSGYVWVPLSEVMTEHNEVQAFWPAYMTDQQTEYYNSYYPTKSPHPRHLNLTIDKGHITASLLDRGLASTSTTDAGPVALAGCKIHFFVGQWWHHDFSDPNDDAFIFFYNNNGEFQVDGNDWTMSTVPVGEGKTDWPVIASSEGLEGFTDPPSDFDEAADHFFSPQQWGFVIYNPAATVTPTISGELGFDNFAVVPEPSAFAMLAIGFSLVFWCLRRTQS